MDKVYKFEIYCETDGQMEHIILEDDSVAPTKCPVDHSHTVTAGSASIIETLEKGTVKQEPKLAHGGEKVARRGFKFNAVAGQETTHDYTIVDTVYLKDAVAITDTNVAGDQLTAQLVHPIAGVLHTYCEDEPVRKNGETIIENDRATETTLAGLILRVIYKSTGESDVCVAVGIGAYMD